MGMKYCPRCRKVVLTKALQNYSQVDFRGFVARDGKSFIWKRMAGVVFAGIRLKWWRMSWLNNNL